MLTRTSWRKYVWPVMVVLVMGLLLRSQPVSTQGIALILFLPLVMNGFAP